MSYFFPSFINSIHIEQELLPQLKNTVNSGTNALRLLLRSFELPIYSKVAIPAFVCNSVREAVEAEKFVPILFDLKPDNTFWTFYDTSRIKEKNVTVVILVHLYGFIHPDTSNIADFCEKNNIKLIHDAAQSYGINEQYLTNGNGIVYSFGPGKSTTAAGGAWIKGYNNNTVFNNIKKPSVFSFQNTKAKLFLKSRIFGYSLGKYEHLLSVLLNKISSNSNNILSMSSFQLKMASYVISNMKNITILRKERYLILKNEIKNNEFIRIAYDDHKGLYFKLVLYVKDEVKYFKKYLNQHGVPYFSLSENITQINGFTNFKETAEKIIEISCESCIPKGEIERIAMLLNNYKVTLY
ncbi:MAG: DegT/DnrJ/EryC1/StrS family aminotransferase [Bacteroidia bacterium]